MVGPRSCQRPQPHCGGRPTIARLRSTPANPRAVPHAHATAPQTTMHRCPTATRRLTCRCRGRARLPVCRPTWRRPCLHETPTVTRCLAALPNPSGVGHCKTCCRRGAGLAMRPGDAQTLRKTFSRWRLVNGGIRQRRFQKAFYHRRCCQPEVVPRAPLLLTRCRGRAHHKCSNPEVAQALLLPRRRSTRSFLALLRPRRGFVRTGLIVDAKRSNLADLCRSEIQRCTQTWLVLRRRFRFHV
mmetsp:Transcript_67770/g.189151  ORF Transcript_67770/g.189151 Transcript_67770/m.189151 type:complete len:242 (-) Transcript_67770:374-1099(-)